MVGDTFYGKKIIVFIDMTLIEVKTKEQKSIVKNIIVNPLPDPNFTESDVTGCHPKCIDFNILT